MLANNLTQILAFSKEEAERLGNNLINPEHLMLAILRKPTQPIQAYFAKKGIDTATLRAELENETQNSTTHTSQPVLNAVIAPSSQVLIRASVIESQRMHSQSIDAEHLMLSLLHNIIIGNNTRKVLENNNINSLEFMKFLNGMDLTDEDEEDIDDADDTRDMKFRNHASSQQTTTKNGKKSKTPMLDRFGTDLTRKAAEGGIDAVIGRQKEIERVMEILCRRKKNNPVLIGEPGVGKSAIVEGLAQRIAQKETSPILFGKRVVSLDLSALVAGTKYRGQFEERMHQLIKELQENDDIILFIDEIHTMIGAGNASGSMDAANILKPALARGEMQCIGATTLEEYRKSIEKDGALERRFQKILVEANTPEETLAILKQIRVYYEKYHCVKYTDEALEACVTLSGRYISDRSFPDKAIDAMDEVGARTHLAVIDTPIEIIDKEKLIEDACKRKNQAVSQQNYEMAAEWRETELRYQQELGTLQQDLIKGKNTQARTITANDVAEVISKMSGVPAKKMIQTESIRIKGIKENLLHDVVAQDEAVNTLVKSIQRNQLGLKDPNRPIGVFMFLGPTGVGKTYLAKKLAEYMFGTSEALIRINMNEYSESFNISRLIGSPPGYVGYEESGELTEKVRRHPYSIVLLDEIEKAHSNIFNLLLQVLDEGKMTDGTGRNIDFRNTVIIMTSNVGTRQLKEFGRGIGFNAGALTENYMLNEKDKEYARNVIRKSLNKQFSPEFLNRLDEIITFDQLDKTALRRIVELELTSLIRRVEEIGYHIQITDKAKDYLAEKGYDIQFGARPLKRTLQTNIEDALAEMIVTQDIAKGTTITINLKKDKLDFKPITP